MGRGVFGRHAMVAGNGVLERAQTCENRWRQRLSVQLWRAARVARHRGRSAVLLRQERIGRGARMPDMNDFHAFKITSDGTGGGGSNVLKWVLGIAFVMYVIAEIFG